MYYCYYLLSDFIKSARLFYYGCFINGDSQKFGVSFLISYYSFDYD